MNQVEERVRFAGALHAGHELDRRSTDGLARARDDATLHGGALVHDDDDVVDEPEFVDSLHDRDDLQMIKGVGPAIEKTLNELGIFRFRQIADMSEYDIDRVARKLKGFHSRIYREDWIGQARELLSQAAQA